MSKGVEGSTPVDTTETILSRQENPIIQNFRRVGGLHEVPLYRCASTDPLADCLVEGVGLAWHHHYHHHHDSDDENAVVRILLQQAGLILDLRSDSERDATKAAAWMDAASFVLQRDRLQLPIIDRSQSPSRIVLRLDLLNASALMSYLDEHWLTTAETVAAFWFKMFDGAACHRLRIKCLNRRGLAGLNEAILETGQSVFLAALQGITLYWEKYPGTPIAIHCVQGKDRTGLLSVLIQSILNCSDDAIVADYQASARSFPPQQSSPGSTAVAGKLDRATFSGAPAPVMVATLVWVRNKYGSVSPGYLDAIGFDAGWRHRFCQAVAATSDGFISNRSRL